MDKDNDQKITDSEIDDLINNFVPPENMELIGILTIILPKKVSILTGGEEGDEEEVGPIDWNLNPDIYTHVFGSICGDPSVRGQLSTSLQQGLQRNFDREQRFNNFFVRSENMAGGGGSCFYFCRRKPDAPRPATALEAQEEQIFHLTIHLGPENDAAGNPILMQQNQRLNALHLTHPNLGRERQLNLAPILMRRIIDQGNPDRDQYFIRLNPLVLQGTPRNALSRTYGPTITNTLNNFLVGDNNVVPLALIPDAMRRRVDLTLNEDQFPALGAPPPPRRGGKKTKTKSKRKMKRKMKSKKNRRNK
jgi:hypothetical protein